MSDPFVAEIRIFPFNFAPKGWAFCDGQLLPISQNTALFSLLGTTYGGDGKSTFALPDLQGSAPMQPGHLSLEPQKLSFKANCKSLGSLIWFVTTPNCGVPNCWPGRSNCTRLKRL